MTNPPTPSLRASVSERGNLQPKTTKKRYLAICAYDCHDLPLASLAMTGRNGLLRFCLAMTNLPHPNKHIKAQNLSNTDNKNINPKDKFAQI